MKGRYSESCRITLHEENFFMREEMTMAYTFSRLIFYAEFKNVSYNRYAPYLDDGT